MKYTAKITGRGSNSTVPDDPRAVDADIYLDGIAIGSVTLRPAGRHDYLSAWGSLDHWANASLISHFAGHHDREEAMSAVVEAVREAAS